VHILSKIVYLAIFASTMKATDSHFKEKNDNGVMDAQCANRGSGSVGT
jgi:hypothetical protein